MGERSGIAAIHSQLLKSHNNNTAFILIVLGFHGLLHLLRPSKRILPTKRPNAARNTYSSPQSGRATALQPVLRPMEVKWRRQLCRIALGKQTPVKRHLDQAWQGASPLQRRLAVATATPLRRTPHPIQMRRSCSAPPLFHRGSGAVRMASSHQPAHMVHPVSIQSVLSG